MRNLLKTSGFAFLLSLLALAPTHLPAQSKTGSSKQTNIILIVADDLGYNDVGYHGSRDIPTPHIDALAKSGVHFTNAYAASPMCQPSRAGFMTGRYQNRFGYESNTDFPAAGLPLSELTLAEALKKEGYATGLVGKWHLGESDDHRPESRGFDEFYGFLSGGHSHLKGELLRGGDAVEIKKGEYSTDLFSAEAVDFVGRHQEHPFFLFLSYNVPHKPIEATEKYLDRFSEIPDRNRRTYAAMVSAMDDGIGDVLRKLKETGNDENTLVIFLSDHGGAGSRGSDNAPFRGEKYSLAEGGIRVPFIMKWAGKIKPGSVYHNPIISLDIFPTCLALARKGRPLPQSLKLDGVDLLPRLEGNNPAPPHPVLFWRARNRHAIRKNNWKLMTGANESLSLYDLSNDVGEENNLASANPEIVQELNDLFMKWDKGLPSPPEREPKKPGKRRRKRNRSASDAS